ncbi:hypothetical protein DM02DRAFT_183505 [Periconia macrospinosa]|uniref:DUF7053 domain-containing protein n=1 Tax=Periconia macrospinosa TaxID=97972 RepID=A0A2V1DBU2_9PLEO|nr:hypothetical protein DM02DRAFT_183505 [Periconia macrospinosa]
MFSLSTIAKLHHITPLPASTTSSSALTKLQDHDLLIRLDPELAHYETLPSEPSAPTTKRYKVTDHMHTLPKGLWDTTVTFESQITNTETGVAWVVKAPLGLVQRTTWNVVKRSEVEGEEVVEAQWNHTVEKEGEVKGEWCLVEDVEIDASKLLVGTVKSKCEQSWRGIHKKFVECLEA